MYIKKTNNNVCTDIEIEKDEEIEVARKHAMFKNGKNVIFIDV